MKMGGKKLLVIGGGGREHAICWKLCQSSEVSEIYVSPGNAGIALVNKVKLVSLNVKNNKEVTEWCQKNGIDLVVVGPEEFLANGIADVLKENGIHCFGPEKTGAQIESDKNWSKLFMDKYSIPTAKWRSFTNADDAKGFINSSLFPALVIKATGLAAGKGVVVAKDKAEAFKAIDEMLVDKKFGAAGEQILIEEVLVGEEVSVLAFTDGQSVAIMPPAQDHKRIFDGDEGPNTGGMGAYAPCHLLNRNDYEIVEKQVLKKVIEGFRKENIHYVGVLYAGIMLTDDGPKVLEFNCRFGDPETQIILPLLITDLFEIMKSCCEKTLSKLEIKWDDKKYAVGVILASRGYPQSSSKGQVITGYKEIQSQKDHFVFHSGTSWSNDQELLTNGGRVMMTTCLSSSLELAAFKAKLAAKRITFDGKQFRNDIGYKGIASSILNSGKLTYKSSGVDIECGDLLVKQIKPLVNSTIRPGVIGSIGGFGGLFDINILKYKKPILVSGTDGVGTKLKLAIEYGKHDTIGIDLVAMCVNDVLAHGAEPLFFLDYFASSHLNVNTAVEVISGIVEGCKMAGCGLVGGETAEMPDMYAPGDYDVAGFAVGVVESSQLLPRSNDIKAGDIVIGLPSSGIHSNGFSLVRKVLKITNTKLTDSAPFSSNKKTVGDELLTPTKIYVKGTVDAFKSNLVKAFAHITGGGLVENIPRVLTNNLQVVLDANKWKIPEIFSWLAVNGKINQDEMLRTFNCGIGAVLICSSEHEKQVLSLLKSEEPCVIGHIKSLDSNQSNKVVVQHFTKVLDQQMRKYVPTLMNNVIKPLKKVGVLISGSGTNLQALIDATKNPAENICAEIVLVISNKSNVMGLKRAEDAGIPTKVINHTDFKSREAFDDAMDEELMAAGVEIICLAGFMRILSEKFVKKWQGALINIHPSLLPSFKGANAHKDVLAAGVRISGCTVHFVAVEIDSGAIIEQESVPVLPGDDVETLQERVKTAEHKAYPKALKLLANDCLKLTENNKIQWN